MAVNLAEDERTMRERCIAALEQLQKEAAVGKIKCVFCKQKTGFTFVLGGLEDFYLHNQAEHNPLHRVLCTDPRFGYRVLGLNPDTGKLLTGGSVVSEPPKPVGDLTIQLRARIAELERALYVIRRIADSGIAAPQTLEVISETAKEALE